MTDDIPEAEKRQIARINELSGVARNNWFALLGYIAFAGVTLLAVEDADFFVESRQTQLPVVNIGIPTQELFLFGPILGAALFAYFHLYLLKLWDGFADASPTVAGEPLGLYVTPWLVNDFALRLLPGDSWRATPLGLVSLAATLLLVFASGPLIVGAFWVRYWPAHEFRDSLFGGFLFVLVTLIALISLAAAVVAIRYHRSIIFSGWHLATATAVALGTLIVMTETVAQTGDIDSLTENVVQGGYVSPRNVTEPRIGYTDPLPEKASFFPRSLDRLAESMRSWFPDELPRARANLSEATLTDLPEDWLPYETHKSRFRIDWCAREGLAPATCGPAPLSGIEPPPHTETMRQHWCGEHERYPEPADCDAYFTTLDDRFSADWRTERKIRRDALDRWSPRNRDLRSANLSSANLVAADLRSAWLQDADLGMAQMEGANFTEAQMKGANLFGAQMEDADLSWAQMDQAVLAFAQMEGAFLQVAQMEGADLRKAQMEDADLGGARMSGVRLKEARMDRAILSSSFLEAADMRKATLRGANLRWANSTGRSSGVHNCRVPT